MLSPAGEGVQGFALRRVPFEGAKRNQKPIGGSMPPNPRGGRNEKFAQPKSGKLALPWSGVAFVVFMIVWWLDRLPVISCSNSAHKGPDQKCVGCRFLNAWANFSKGMESKSIFFYPNIFWRTSKIPPRYKKKLRLFKNKQNFSVAGGGKCTSQFCLYRV